MDYLYHMIININIFKKKFIELNHHIFGIWATLKLEQLWLFIWKFVVWTYKLRISDIFIKKLYSKN